LLLPLPVYEAVYDGLSRCGWLVAHRVSASCAQHDRLVVERQSKLESFEENNFSNYIVVRCGNRRRKSALRNVPLTASTELSRDQAGFTGKMGSRYNPPVERI
jgi:hypothetical protein